MILVAGGSISAAESAALVIFEAGHIPVVGEWFASPLVAGTPAASDREAAFDDILGPVAERLLRRCDGVLRVDGPSAAADEMVGLAQSRGLRVFFDLDDALAG